MHSIFDYILHLLCILVDMFDHIILQIIFLILHIIFNCISHTLCTFNCILEHDVLPTTLHILHIESCSYFAYWETFTFFAYYCAYYLAYYHAYFCTFLCTSYIFCMLHSIYSAVLQTLSPFIGTAAWFPIPGPCCWFYHHQWPPSPPMSSILGVIAGSPGKVCLLSSSSHVEGNSFDRPL